MPTGSKSVRLVIALVLATTSFPAAAAASAWTTYLRAGIYTDLATRHDTVWCASLDGGLLRYLSATDRFESIPREPGGLTSQAITALAFDRSGRLWVGSSDHGVSRLSADGGHWDPINELDGLPRGAVNVMRALGDTMFIGTDHGVALWNGSDIVGTVPDGVNASPFASDVINGVVLRGDSLWVATSKGLYVSRASTELTTWTLAAPVFAGVAMLALAWDGSTLMTLSGGLPLVFEESGRVWIPHGGIGSVGDLSDEQGTIIASSNLGIYRWDGGGWVSIPGSDGIVARGAVVSSTDETGRLWSANGAGLFEWAGAAWTLHVPDAPVGNNVQNIALQGPRVYIATNSDGVGRFDGTRWRNWYSGQCVSGCDTTFLNSAYAFALLVDQQGMKWVGNYGSAVESFDDDRSPPAFVHHQPGDDPVSRHQHTTAWIGAYDASGGRWFGMDTDNESPPIGIEYYGPTGDYVANYQTSNTPDMPSGLVRALLVDEPHGNLWAGYRGTGVTVFKLPTEPGGALILSPLGGAMSSIATLDIFGIAMHRDSVWVMSTADLRLFNSLTLRQIGGALPLVGSPAPIGACHPLDVGPDGTVWVGTDAGVHAYRRGTSVVEYNVSNSPLAGDVVRAIRVDPVSGVVWIGTETGLSRFDPAYVAPAPPPLPPLAVRVYPNPAMLTGAGLALRVQGTDIAYLNAVYQVSVFDASGRKLHRGAVKNEGRFWDGTDPSGSLVHPGIYFVRVEAGGYAQTLRVAVLR